jgi:hypothetical protein
MFIFGRAEMAVAQELVNRVIQEKKPRIRKRDLLRKFVSGFSKETFVQSSTSVGLVVIGYSIGRITTNFACAEILNGVDLEFNLYKKAMATTKVLCQREIDNCYSLLQKAF